MATYVRSCIYHKPFHQTLFTICHKLECWVQCFVSNIHKQHPGNTRFNKLH